MHCLQCGAFNLESHRFCTKCGAGLVPGAVVSAPPVVVAAVAAAPPGAVIPPLPPAPHHQLHLIDSLKGRIDRLASTEKLEGFSLSEMFSEVFKHRTQEETEQYFLVGTSHTTPPIQDCPTGWPKPWFFARMLAFLCLTYAVLDYALRLWPENLNLIPGLLMMGSLAVPLSTAILVFEMNTPRNVSFYEVLRLFLIGGVISLLVALFEFEWSPLSWLGSPEAGAVSYQYNAFNQVTQRTDARGVVTTYTYDGLNRPYQVSYNVGATGVPATSTVTYTYGTSSASNNNGRLLSVADGSNTETYSYDVLGQVTQAQKLISGSTYTVGYAYNLAGELTAITYPEQYPNTTRRVVGQNYDAIGRLATIFSGATNYASSYAYNPGFEVTGFNYGNGVTASFGYTPERLLLQTVSYSTASQTLLSLSYGYTHPNGGKNGQITNVTDNVDNGRTVNYAYDALYRVSTAVTTGSGSYPQWGLAWSYDRYGNRTGQTVTAGSAPSSSLVISTTTNRISGFIYDANGNLTFEPGTPSYSYQYDAENRMVSFNAGTATYTYLGALRVKKVSGSTTTVYVFSGSKVIAEYVNAALSKEYVYSGGSLLATLDPSGTPTYRHNDQLSARLETDSAGAVARSFGHYPFGESWYETGTAGKWQFTSYERDSESGNDYAMNRYYQNRLGRFSSPDLLPGSVADPQSLNRYAYVGNNPVNLVDPFGLQDLPNAPSYVGGTLPPAPPPINIPLSYNGSSGTSSNPWPYPSGNAAGDPIAGTLLAGGVAPKKYLMLYPNGNEQDGGGGRGGDESGDNSSSWTWNFTKSFFKDFSLKGQKGKELCFVTFAKTVGSDFNPFTLGPGTAAEVGSAAVVQGSQTAAVIYAGQRVSAVTGAPGLICPMCSSTVRGILAGGKTAGAALTLVVFIGSEVRGLRNEMQAMAAGACDAF